MEIPCKHWVLLLTAYDGKHVLTSNCHIMSERIPFTAIKLKFEENNKTTNKQ